MNRVETIVGHIEGKAPTVADGNLFTMHGPIGSTRSAVNVVVTGACGNIAYAILFMIAEGQMLGSKQRVNLRLLDIPPMADAIKGVAMEIIDCAFPLVNEVSCYTDANLAFQDADICLLIGAKPRGPGMDRADLLQANAAIFKAQGAAINAHARKSVKVLVVGNPANTNAYIAMMNAPDIPRTAFTAMTRLDMNRAIGQVATKLNVSTDSVKNVTIWGNHSNTMFPDLSASLITDYPTRGQVTPAAAAINDVAWINNTFVNDVALRGGAIIKARGKSSAASAAQAAVDHMRSWCLGTEKGEWVAMAVPSDGSYGIPKGLIFSFPCVAAHGHYSIVKGLKISEVTKQKLKANVDELMEEKKQAGY